MTEHRIVGQINRRPGHLYFVDGKGFVKEAALSKGKRKTKKKILAEKKLLEEQRLEEEEQRLEEEADNI